MSGMLGRGPGGWDHTSLEVFTQFFWLVEGWEEFVNTTHVVILILDQVPNHLTEVLGKGI